MKIESLIERGPNYIIQFIGGPASEFEGVNLHGLAFACATEGHRCSDDPKWYEASALVYEYLMKNCDSDSERTSFECSSINERIKVINSYRISDSTQKKNVEVIEAWFRHSVSHTASEIVEKAHNWKERPIDEIRYLRNIKNTLNILENLVGIQEMEIGCQFHELLSIKEQLP